jgi:hypothetical protein
MDVPFKKNTSFFFLKSFFYKLPGKIRGGSLCNDEKGIYKISAKEDKLFMTVINDNCNV